jgi:hypothetical protein
MPGLVLIVVVVMVFVVVVIATTLYVFELVAAFAGLFAVLAVAMDRVAQLILGLVNLSFTGIIPVVSVLRPYWEGRSHQACDRQQCNAKNSDHSGHVFSLVNR